MQRVQTDMDRKRFSPWGHHRALLCKATEQVLELLLPDRCRICNAPLAPGADWVGICRQCAGNITCLDNDRWCRCGRTRFAGVARDQRCARCLRRPPSYLRAVALFSYEEPVSILLRRLKFQSDTTVLPPLASIVRSFGFAADFSPDWIVPVPLHAKRLRDRGLNQSLLLARLLYADQPEKINPFLLQRSKNTIPQTGLDGAARRKNLKGGFAVGRPDLVRGRRICLVDDVFTTGTTVEECSKTLVKAGALDVFVVTVARVVVKE